MMRILLIGHGKMGQLVGELAGEYGCEVAGVIDPNSPKHGGGPDDERWSGIEVAIELLTRAERVATSSALLENSSGVVLDEACTS